MKTVFQSYISPVSVRPAFLAEPVRRNYKKPSLCLLNSQAQASRGKTIDAPSTSHAGIALDIGTTTIAAASVEPGTGRIIGAISLPNPQAAWGADVLSRVEAIRRNPALLPEMSGALIGACNEAIHALLPDTAAIEVTVAGNSVMEHILLGISPLVFAAPPYKPAFKKAVRVPCGKLGIAAAQDAEVYVFPLIGGFVGGDTTAVALALGLHREEEPTLTIDIGTNSEIVLTANGIIYAASAAAGPAFESGGIKDGMTAAPGAISGIRMTEDAVSLETIGNATPAGICGSGLVAAAAAMLDAGVMDSTGRINDRIEIATNIGNHIVERDGANAFILYRGAKKVVSLTQADIRSLQTAKAAIKAGISILIAKAGLTAGEIRKVYLAGAFGSNLKKEALCRIGLLAPEWLPLVRFVGDAALIGAAEAVGSEDKKNEAELAASMVKYMALSGSPRFEREFLKEMNFPKKG